MKHDATELTRIGERFGEQIAALVSRCLAFTATVESVADNHANVIRFEGDTPIRVPLRLLNTETAGLVVTPKIGSTVVVLNADGNVNTPLIIAVEELDGVSVNVGETRLEIDADVIKINSGELGGLVKVDGLTSRLNTIERDINALKQAFSTWVVVPSDGGAALKAATSVWATQSLSLTKNNDYENDKILQ